MFSITYRGEVETAPVLGLKNGKLEPMLHPLVSLGQLVYSLDTRDSKKKEERRAVVWMLAKQISGFCSLEGAISWLCFMILPTRQRVNLLEHPVLSHLATNLGMNSNSGIITKDLRLFMYFRGFGSSGERLSRSNLLFFVQTLVTMNSSAARCLIDISSLRVLLSSQFSRWYW